MLFLYMKTVFFFKNQFLELKGTFAKYILYVQEIVTQPKILNFIQTSSCDLKLFCSVNE